MDMRVIIISVLVATGGIIGLLAFAIALRVLRKDFYAVSLWVCLAVSTLPGIATSWLVYTLHLDEKIHRWLFPSQAQGQEYEVR